MDALREVQRKSKLLNLEVEDFLTSSHQTALMAVFTNLLLDGRDWNSFVFVDAIQASDFAGYQTLKQTILRDFENTPAVSDLIKNTPSVVKLRANITIPSETEANAMLKTFRALQEDSNLQSIRFSGALFGASNLAVPERLSQLMEDIASEEFTDKKGYIPRKLSQEITVHATYGWDTLGDEKEVDHTTCMACINVLETGRAVLKPSLRNAMTTDDGVATMVESGRGSLARMPSRRRVALIPGDIANIPITRLGRSVSTDGIAKPRLSRSPTAPEGRPALPKARLSRSPSAPNSDHIMRQPLRRGFSPMKGGLNASFSKKSPNNSSSSGMDLSGGSSQSVSSRRIPVRRVLSRSNSPKNISRALPVRAKSLSNVATGKEHQSVTDLRGIMGSSSGRALSATALTPSTTSGASTKSRRALPGRSVSGPGKYASSQVGKWKSSKSSGQDTKIEQSNSKVVVEEKSKPRSASKSKSPSRSTSPRKCKSPVPSKMMDESPDYCWETQTYQIEIPTPCRLEPPSA